MFKLTLRELFLLVLIAAVGCGWWVHHSREVKDREKSEYLLKYDIGMLLLQRDSWERKFREAEHWEKWAKRKRESERQLTEKERYESKSF